MDFAVMVALGAAVDAAVLAASFASAVAVVAVTLDGSVEGAQPSDPAMAFLDSLGGA